MRKVLMRGTVLAVAPYQFGVEAWVDELEAAALGGTGELLYSRGATPAAQLALLRSARRQAAVQSWANLRGSQDMTIAPVELLPPAASVPRIDAHAVERAEALRYG